MPGNEIDDIFSSNGKGKAKVGTEKVGVAESKPKKDKKKKKRKADALDDSAPAVASSSKEAVKPAKAVAVTVFKESSGADSERATKRQKTSSKSTEPVSSVKKAKSKPSVKEEDDRFRDSRGTGPRKKTEEGWSVYKEDELGINDAGGALRTPSCLTRVIGF
ncbi:hypothetical protein AURDEDRAFT_119721 [Auricularia subglabra TFB-10046 SS5]|nr:hypothetical protein AURDEDRAFT_119721 [Auricularia subglabra TFB-10046 SS5]